ncbi:hypothetical protein G7Y89_g5345 [Cudoniella acicularis]|uniref:Uncharacterized protein n=1 Tax=Cudoniella acicularis TaxID=354080 RepID=A0A8H4RMP2_9HELO|nr:hypothetical protein G7Y89_g5345 [Cudoniella acicularis]
MELRSTSKTNGYRFQCKTTMDNAGTFYLFHIPFSADGLPQSIAPHVRLAGYYSDCPSLAEVAFLVRKFDVEWDFCFSQLQHNFPFLYRMFTVWQKWKQGTSRFLFTAVSLKWLAFVNVLIKKNLNDFFQVIALIYTSAKQGLKDPPDLTTIETGQVTYPRKTYLQKLSVIDKKRPNRILDIMLAPFKFFRFPVVVWAGFMYGTNGFVWLGILNATASPLYTDTYHFNSNDAGFAYFGAVFGMVLGSLWVTYAGPQLVMRLARRNKGVAGPEHILWLFLASLIYVPFTMLLWGLRATYKTHWFGLVFAQCVLSISSTLCLSTAIQYATSSYRDLSGEITTTIIIIRNTLSFAINYGITPWIKAQGQRDTFITVAAIALVCNATIKLFVVTRLSYYYTIPFPLRAQHAASKTLPASNVSKPRSFKSQAQNGLSETKSPDAWTRRTADDQAVLRIVSDSTKFGRPFAGELQIAFTLSTSQQSPPLAAELTNPISSIPNDFYDGNDPVTPIPQQRQQQRISRRTHIEATSTGISPPSRARFTEQRRSEQQQLTNEFEDELATSTPAPSSSQRSQHYSPEAERRPHRALRISKNTASAILYALEEALRHPNPFTPDLVEENASMSDLIGGGPSASAGNGRSNNGNSRPQVVPGATGSPVIKGPREIMRERAARETQKRAEQEAREALERSRAEEEARQIEENNRRSEERRARTAAGAAALRGSGEGSQRVSGSTGPRVSGNSQRSERRSEGETGRTRGPVAYQGAGTGGAAVGGGDSSRPRPTQSQQQPRPVQQEASRSRPSQSQPVPAATGPSNPQPPTSEAGGAAPTRSSFPHAFERWETLSAHWEGLTSFWIRRLEENSNEINRDPLSQQLSRQVTDLSAAGANLFHAVVELQRLRASSERKFQRWFFETRAEQERAQEIQAMTENSLESERRERAAAIAEAVAKERERSNVDKQLAEMKRELQISKEEARRAWEELGRREQEERERTASLREGQPTLVGGVQVVPMMQGVPSRHGSTRDVPPTRDGPLAGGSSGNATEPEGPVDIDTAYQQYSRAQRAEPADPFVEQPRNRGTTAHTQASTSPPTSYAQEYSPAPAVQPASTGAFYQQQQGTSLHPVERDPSYGQSAPSEGAFSEGEYEIDDEGHFVLDARGNKIPYHHSDDGTDEYDVVEQQEQERANLRRYGQGTSAEYGENLTATSGRVAPPSSQPSTEPGGADYSGAGYGGGPGLEWGAVPRHHHPTRLSDVLEEDERSRTSASLISRRE